MLWFLLQTLQINRLIFSLRFNVSCYDETYLLELMRKKRSKILLLRSLPHNQPTNDQDEWL